MPTTLERKQAAAAKARMAKRRKKSKSARRHNFHPKPTTPIESDKVYPLEIVPKLFGISRHTLAKAQLDGLKTSKLGSRKFVDGKSLIDFLKSRSS